MYKDVGLMAEKHKSELKVLVSAQYLTCFYRSNLMFLALRCFWEIPPRLTVYSNKDGKLVQSVAAKIKTKLKDVRAVVYYRCC